MQPEERQIGQVVGTGTREICGLKNVRKREEVPVTVHLSYRTRSF
jgi:hypothetical protein